MDNRDRVVSGEKEELSLENLVIPKAKPRPVYQTIKRICDVIGAIVLLILLSPVFFFVAIAVRLDSHGPIIFRQKRIGLCGRAFTFYKFRSMCIDAEVSKQDIVHLNEVDGPIFKIRNDPRVTRVGRWLRRYSIDELPQILNVLKGDMSFVGPRPPLPDEVVKYEEWHLRRLSVIPGITCFWQISGRSKLSFEEWVLLDLKYIDSRSLSSDLRILLKTVPAVLSGDGAY